MVNSQPLKFIPRFAFDQFIKPQYGSYNFGRIHDTILRLFDVNSAQTGLPNDCFGEQYPEPEVVVFFFIDGFGWKFWQEADSSLTAIAQIKEEGRLTPLTTLFPSTTAASVTNFHTGLLPTQHGLYEWNLYIPAYDEVIQTLLFAPLGDRTQDRCLQLGFDPNHLVPSTPTLMGRLESAGVKTIQFVPRDYSSSAYNQIIGRGGSSVQPYRSTGEALAQIKESIRLAKGKTFLYFYLSDIDGAMHAFGPDSDEAKVVIADFWTNFAKTFLKWRKPSNTKFLFTADHGQIGVDPSRAVYLNQLLPNITEWLKTHRDGRPILPNGSARDVFLHIKPEFVDTAMSALTEKLDLKALVMKTNDAMAQGLFGPVKPSEEFLKRLGQILILPYENRQVWWYEPPRMFARHKGMHGGLSADEALTALAVW